VIARCETHDYSMRNAHQPYNRFNPLFWCRQPYCYYPCCVPLLTRSLQIQPLFRKCGARTARAYGIAY